MYNILIVDDEVSVCEGLEVLIDWNKAGFRVRDIAHDGDEALEKLNKMNYDVVITDIRMPGLSGLELIQVIRERYAAMKIIIISGYSDFNYAKQAIKFGVKGYLLKPIDREDLIVHMVELKNELDSEQESGRQLRDHRNMVIDKLLFEFASGTLSEGKFKQRAEIHKVHMDSSYYATALIEIDNFFEYVEQDLESANLKKFAVRNITEEIVRDKGLGIVYEDSGGKLGIILHGKYLMEGIQQLNIEICELHRTVEKFGKLKTRIGIGSLVTNLSEIKESRKKAIYALESSILSHDDRVIIHDYLSEYDIPIWDWEWDPLTLVASIEQLNVVHTDEHISRLIEEIFLKPVSLDTIRTIVYQVIYSVSSVLRTYNGQPGRIVDIEFTNKLKSEMPSCAHLEQWLKAYCRSASAYLIELQSEKSPHIIDQIKSYVDLRYREDLSLKSIAAEFYMSPAYLGRIFKSMAGEAFHDYLNKVRISNAKKLFLSQNSKISSIITEVGYNNHEHFYRQFKRYEGISFAGYKDKLELLTMK